MFQQSPNLSVYIKHDEHANLDSLPLRFGFYFKENTVLDLFECGDFKHQEDNRIRFTGKFIDSRGDEVEGTFVGLKDAGKYLKLVTVWRNDQRTEQDLSSHLRTLRENHQITPDELVEIWPDYVKGEASSVAGLIATIKRRYQRNADIQIEEANKRAAEAARIAEEALTNQPYLDEDDITERVAAKVLDRLSKQREPGEDDELSSIDSMLEDASAPEEKAPPKIDASLDNLKIERLDQSILASKITKLFGPPGTGKTTTLIKLVKEAVASGIQPSEIGFFSFTNFATKVAKQRVNEAFPDSNVEEDFNGFRTLHSLAYQTLPSKLNLLTPEQAREFDEGFIVEEVMLEEDDVTSLVYRAKHPVIDSAAVARSRLISFDAHLRSLNEADSYRLNKWLGYPAKMCNSRVNAADIPKLVAFNDAFENYKRVLGVIDYTTILELACLQTSSIPDFKVVFVDEAQDLSALQWAFAERVMMKADKIYLAGDDDQAICQSFGAAPEELVTYQCANEIPLEQSYRIPPRVHQYLFAERGIVNRLKDFFVRKEKSWNAKTGEGKEREEGLVAPISWNDLPIMISKHRDKDWLIMAATHQSLQIISNSLRSMEVPHILSNRVVVPRDEEHLPSIRLSTIWGAKGGEAAITVILMGQYVDTKMLEADPRLLYVAFTRTKDIHLICNDRFRSQTDVISDAVSQSDDVLFEKRTQSAELNVILEPRAVLDSSLQTNDSDNINNALKEINSGKQFTAECLAKAATLDDVIWVQRGPNKGIGLVMSDGSTRVKIYGDLDKTFEVAQMLKGRRIATVPANPSKNPITEWFNDIKLHEE